MSTVGRLASRYGLYGYNAIADKGIFDAMIIAGDGMRLYADSTKRSDATGQEFVVGTRDELVEFDHGLTRVGVDRERSIYHDCRSEPRLYAGRSSICIFDKIFWYAHLLLFGRCGYGSQSVHGRGQFGMGVCCCTNIKSCRLAGVSVLAGGK